MLPVDFLNEYVSNCRDKTGYRQRPTTNRGSLASNSATVSF